jgi:hypothetical protein
VIQLPCDLGLTAGHKKHSSSLMAKSANDGVVSRGVASVKSEQQIKALWQKWSCFMDLRLNEMCAREVQPSGELTTRFH